MKFLFRSLAAAISLLFTGALLTLLVATAIVFYFAQELPDYTELANYDPDIVTRLYAADGKLLAEYATEKRVYVPLKAIPQRVSRAFISAEDKNFYSNNGIDPYGIARAFVSNVRSFLAHTHAMAGGSTITQQVVKNFLLTPEKSITRKIKEAVLAFRITKVYNKDRILELYLNEIYLGRGSYGVAAAALNYFNKSLDTLTIEESAFLAALPQAPARSDPLQHYERAKERRDWVINRMMDDHIITAEEARSAIATPITLRARDKTETASADFFAEEVRREIAAKYGDDALYKGGLFVKTTLDPLLQQYADEGLRLALREYDHRHGYRGPIAQMSTLDSWQKQLTTILTQKKIPLFDAEQLGVVLGEQTGRVMVGLDDGKKGILDKESVTWAQHKKLSVGDVFIVAPNVNSTHYEIHQIPLVNGALIVMDPHTGRVLSMSGGYSYGGTEFNRATQAKRQPGSSFKPFVYLAGLESGLTPASIIVDEPVELSQGEGMPVWRPTNYHGGYLGPATIRVALEKSRNAMTVKLGQMLGIDRIIEMGKRFGIYDNLPPQFSLVLGAQETTLIRLANAYCMLANGGKKVSPSLIERIDDKDGKTIMRRDTRICKDCMVEDVSKATAALPPLPADERQQIVDQRTAYQMVYMLQGVVERGTAARARKLGRPLAGKTGTTNDSRDTWFIGFSPDLVVGVFVGYDHPQTLGKRETGASVALPGFIRFMELAMKDKPVTSFHVPPGIEFIQTDQKTGTIPLPGDINPVVLEAFKKEEPAAPQGPEFVGPAAPIVPKYEFPAENPKPISPPPAAPANPFVPPQEENQGGTGTGGLY